MCLWNLLILIQKWPFNHPLGSSAVLFSLPASLPLLKPQYLQACYAPHHSQDDSQCFGCITTLSGLFLIYLGSFQLLFFTQLLLRSLSHTSFSHRLKAQSSGHLSSSLCWQHNFLPWTPNTISVNPRTHHLCPVPGWCQEHGTFHSLLNEWMNEWVSERKKEGMTSVLNRGGFLFLFLFLFLTMPCGFWGFSSLTKDWIWALCSKNTEF